MAPAKQVANISPDRIAPNPENPRLIFRQDELDALANSIARVGILVPLAVYEKPSGNRFVLIDGERRWKCARKLSLRAVPAIVEPKPTKLENILRMFDIHNVRVQWDLLAIALKLQEIEELLAAARKPNTPKDISILTGLSRATVDRAFDLLTLPRKYRRLLLRELEKPKSAQQFSEDLFIEMSKAMRVMKRYVPEVYRRFPRERLIGVLFEKYRKKIIKNVVAFRKISRIARAERVGVAKRSVIPTLDKLLTDPGYSIEDAYAESVSFAYEARQLLSVIAGLTARLQEVVERGADLRELRGALQKLRAVIGRALDAAP